MTRRLVPALATLCFAIMALLYAIDRPVYFALLDAIHAHPFPRPFLDARFVTAQVECWSRGIDVYARNPCDPLGRTLDYSPLWLRLSFLARPDSATPLFGLAIDLAFLLALFAMPWPSQGAFALPVSIAAVLSWATIYAMERANTDLLMFAVSVLVARLSIGPAATRLAAYALVLAAGLLKFYPLALLALLIREPGRRAWILAGLCAAPLAVFAIAFHAELGRIGSNMASALFGDMFGARGLPFGLPLLAGHAPIRAPSGLYVGPGALDPAAVPLAWTLFAALSAACGLTAIRFGRSTTLVDPLARIDPTARRLLLVGAILCVSCFFAHQNIGYRAVLLLLALPGLLALARAARAARTRLLFRTTALLAILVFWTGFASRSIPGWLILQLAWWWIATVLLAIAVALLGGDAVRLVSGLRRDRVRAQKA